MSTTLIAKNVTSGPAVDLTLSQLPIPNNTIPASGQVTLTDFATVNEIQDDVELIALINADSVLINDGTTDLTKTQSLAIVQTVAGSSPGGIPEDLIVTSISASSFVSSSLFYGDGSNLINLPAGSPVGSNTEIQYNADGAFGADPQFTWASGSNTLTVTGDISGSGNISGSAFYGDGANLTSLDASNISAGTLDNARLPATISVTNVTASTLVSASNFYGDGANLTNLNASNISAGTLDNARLPATISVTNVTASSLVSASFFYGDGSNLINVPADPPAGSNTQIQYNADGAFGSDADFTWSSGSNTLTVTGDISASINVSGSGFYGGGANLTDLNASNISAGTLDNARLPATISVTNVTASTLVSASNFYGDGSTLSNIIATGDAAGGDLGGTYPNPTVNDGADSTAIHDNIDGEILAIAGKANPSGADVVLIEDSAASYAKKSVLLSALTGNAAGSNTQIQFNADGNLGADADFTWASGSNTLTVTGDISASVNISGSDFYGGGANLTDLDASNISAGTLDNARLPTTISVTNVTASTLVSASNFYGDGSNLTGIAAGSDTQVQYKEAGKFASDADFTWDKVNNILTLGGVSGSGNISGSDFYGGGANLTDLNASNISAGTLDNARLPATISVTNVTASALVSASFLYGDGSNLTNLPAGSPGGLDTQIQFNDGGVFNGDADFTWNSTSNSLTVTGSINLSGGYESGDGTNFHAFSSAGLESSFQNSTTIKEVSSQSDFDQPLSANTTYIVRGEVTLTTTLTASNDGIAIHGSDRNVDKIIWAGASGSACINVDDVDFEIRTLGFSSSVDGNSILSASNYTGGGFNQGRLKVFAINDCQFRGCSNIADFIGFDLIDISNTLFWYSTAPDFGLRFSSTSKTEISSCEFIRWFDESEIPSPVTFASASMIEFMPTGSRAGFGAVNINGCVLHPQLSQNGIKINAGSATGFGTIAANTFVDANLGPGLKFFPDPLAGGYSNTECLKYDISVNQGIPNSIAYGMGYFSGSVTGQAATTFTLVDVNSSFNEANSQRISISNTGEMTYNGTKDIYVTIAAAITMVAGAGNADIEFALFKSSSAGGNIQLSGSSGRARLKTGGDVATVPLLYSTTLASGDKIGVYYDALNNDFDLENLTLSIKE